MAGENSGTRLDQARRAVIHLKGEFEEATTKRDSLRKEIATVPPMLAVDRGPQVVVNGGRPLSPDEARLAELQKSLDSLRLKYTEQHPDVIATRQAMAQVQAEMKRSSGSPSGAGAAAAARSRSQIAFTTSSRSSWSTPKVSSRRRSGVSTMPRRSRHGSRRSRRSAPGVVAQAQDLDRDYGVLKKNYEELVARREAAQIANSADTKTEKIQFRIIDPPQIPTVPAAPNRPMLVSIVLLFGIGAGLATPMAVAQLDRSFATVGQLRNLGIPILGSVSRLSLGAARRRAAIQLAGVCASAFVLLAVYGTLMAVSVGLHAVGVS